MRYEFIEKNVIVKGEYNLGATITIPQNASKKMNAVVIVPGTGNSDRDGNNSKKNFNMNIYKDLAHFFASIGLVVIRYDKRGTHESKGDAYKCGVNDLVSDVISNVKYLESLEYVDKVILCGHSEGSILIPLANEKYKCSGMIQIAGAGMCIRTALEYQNYIAKEEIKEIKGLKGFLMRKAVNDKNYLNKVNKLFDKVNNTDKDVIRVYGAKTPAKWLREHDKITDDIAWSLMKNSGCPILAVTGSKDAQANPKIMEKINKFNQSHITEKVIPNMDHILKEFDGEITVLNIMKQYQKEFDKPIHPMFLEEVEKWITDNKLL